MSQGSPSAEAIKQANARYHDAAAGRYDTKWGIDFGEIGRRQVLTKLAKALGREPGRYAEALEVGAGTGYFSINLLSAGVIEHATATDISAGMLEQLAATAASLGLAVSTVEADAERLPLADDSFDLVLGHAVLHHLPDLGRALTEFARVLRPGGTLVFMGEPSRYGDRLAALPKRLGTLAAPAWRRLLGVDGTRNGGSGSGDSTRETDERLEPWVDVHVFSPAQLRALAARAGLLDIRVSGEELVASTYGWLLRALQADADPADVPRSWHLFAFRSYLALRCLDGKVLEPRLPAACFYNLLLSARKPG